MSFAAHGNWCGPGWSARQWKDAKDLTEEDKQVEAIDELDQACKEHDIGIAEGDPLANQKFYTKAAQAGWYGLTLAQFVKIGGPPLQNYLRGGEEVNQSLTKRRNMVKGEWIGAKRRTPKDNEEYYEAWKSENSIRLKENAKKKKEELKEFNRDENRVYNPSSTDEESKQADDRVIEAIVDMQGDTPMMAPGEDPNLTAGKTASQSSSQFNSSARRTINFDSPNMNGDAGEPMQVLSNRQSNESSASNGKTSRETPVMYNARAEMGIFTETRTVYLPLTVYFSINNCRQTNGIPVRIRMDWPYDIFKNTTLVAQSISSTFGTNTKRARGVSNDQAMSNDRFAAVGADAHLQPINSRDPASNRGQLIPFPHTVVGSTNAVPTGTTRTSSFGAIADAACVPAYRKFYAKNYQYAHCMETDYKITYWSADANEHFQNITVFEAKECISTGNVDFTPSDQPLGLIQHWPHLKQHNIRQRTTESPQSKYVISGTWTDNEHYINKMVANDENNKVWHKLAANDFTEKDPAFREELQLIHYQNEDSISSPAYVNMRIDLRYKIQFKDIASGLRWLGTGNPYTMTSADCIQVPITREQIKCDGYDDL